MPITVKQFDRLFGVEDPEADKETDFLAHLNPDSKVVVDGAIGEPSLAELQPGETVQFERQGYFCADSVESAPGNPVFNRTVTLRDSWESKKK